LLPNKIKLSISITISILIVVALIIYSIPKLDLVLGQSVPDITCFSDHQDNTNTVDGKEYVATADATHCYQNGVEIQFCSANTLSVDGIMVTDRHYCSINGISSLELFKLATGKSDPYQYCSSLGGILGGTYSNFICYMASSVIDHGTSQTLVGTLGDPRSPITDTIITFESAKCQNPPDPNYPCPETDIAPVFLPLSLPVNIPTPPPPPPEPCNPDYEECPTECPDGEHKDENSVCVPDSCPDTQLQQLGLVFPLSERNVYSNADPNCPPPPVCSDEEKERAASVRTELSGIMGGWTLAGFDHSVNALQHWLSGVDGTVDLTDWLKTEPTVSSSANTNLQRFQSLPSDGGNTKGQLLSDVIKDVDKDGITRNFYAIWEVDHSVNLNTDLGNTLGSFKLRSEGVFTVQKIDKSSIFISGQVTHMINDLYNFNPDSVYDRYNILKKCDGAADYNNVAQWKHTVNISDKPNKLIKMVKDGTLPFVLIP